MKLRVLGSNQTEVETKGFTVLFSYNTPVACCDNSGKGFFKTSKKWSKTTSKHINLWLNGAKATEKDQSFFDSLV
jgi:hypothetical protein